jgi:Glycerophosphoryl diester phosphodiesterase
MNDKNVFRIDEGGRPLIISHGSAWQLGPDNALVSFEKYMTMKVDFIEMDLCITKDDILITHHDEAMRGNDDEYVCIREWNFEDIAKINIAKDYTDIFGNRPYENEVIRVAAFEELLQRYGNNPKNISFMIELKNTGAIGEVAAEVLCGLLTKYEMENKAIICSFDEPTMEHFRKVSGGRFYTSTTIDTTRDFVVNTLSGTGDSYVCPDRVMSLPMEEQGYDLAAKQIIDEAHKRNMSVTYWTISDKPTMRELIAKGADGIITDRPDIMYELLMEMGFNM